MRSTRKLSLGLQPSTSVSFFAKIVAVVASRKLACSPSFHVEKVSDISGLFRCIWRCRSYCSASSSHSPSSRPSTSIFTNAAKEPLPTRPTHARSFTFAATFDSIGSTASNVSFAPETRNAGPLRASSSEPAIAIVAYWTCFSSSSARLRSHSTTESQLPSITISPAYKPMQKRHRPHFQRRGNLLQVAINAGARLGEQKDHTRRFQVLTELSRLVQ